MANYDVIKTYGIEITAVTDKATDQINQLEKELDELSKKKGLSAGLQSQIDKIGESLNGLKGEIVSSTKSINDNLSKINTEKMSKEFKDMQSSIESSVDSMKEKMEELQDSIKFISDPKNTQGFASGIGKQFDELKDTVLGTVQSLGLVSQTLDKILSGQKDFSSLEALEKSMENAGKNVKSQSTKLKKQLGDALQDLNVLLGKNKNLKIGNIMNGNVEHDISDIVKLQGELKRVLDLQNKIKSPTAVNDVYGKAGINLTQIKTLYEEVNNYIDGFNNGDDFNAKRNIHITAELDMSNKEKLIDQLNFITDTIQKEVKPIKIPIGYTIDRKAVIKNSKSVEQAERDIENRTIEENLIRSINVDVNANVNNLVNDVNSKIKTINEELKTSGKKIEVEVIGKINNENVSQAAKDLKTAFENEQNVNIQGANISGGTLTFDSASGIATEDTLSDIKSILSQWNSTGLPGTTKSVKNNTVSNSSIPEDSKGDFDKLYRRRWKNNALTKAKKAEAETTDMLYARYALKDEYSIALKEARKTIGKRDLEAFHKTQLYNAKFEHEGVEYSLYDSSKTLVEWKKMWDDAFNVSTESINEIRKQIDELRQKRKSALGKEAEDIDLEVSKLEHQLDKSLESSILGGAGSNGKNIKGLMDVQKKAAEDAKKSLRESLKINNIYLKKDKSGRYTKDIIDEKSVITSTEDSYLKTSVVVDRIVEETREAFNYEMDKKNELIEQRNLMLEIASLEERQSSGILSPEDSQVLELKRKELEERSKDFRLNQDSLNQIDKLLEREGELKEKRVTDKLSTSEYKELTVDIPAQIEELYKSSQDLSSYMSENLAQGTTEGLTKIDEKIQSIHTSAEELVKNVQKSINLIYNPISDNSAENDLTKSIAEGRAFKHGRKGTNRRYDDNTVAVWGEEGQKGGYRVRSNKFTTVPVNNRQQYDAYQKKIAALEKENARIERLIVKKGTKNDYSALTRDEYDTYWSNRNHIETLKTRNKVYAEANNLAAELLKTEEKIENTTGKSSIGTLHTKGKEGLEELLGARARENAKREEEARIKSQERGFEVKADLLSDQDFIKQLSDEDLGVALSSLTTLVNNIENQTELSAEQLRSLAEHRIKEDIEGFKASILKKENEIKSIEEKIKLEPDEDKKKNLQYGITDRQREIKGLQDSIEALESPTATGSTKRLDEAKEVLVAAKQERADIIEKIKQENGLTDEQLEKLQRVLKLNRSIDDSRSKLSKNNRELSNSVIGYENEVETVKSEKGHFEHVVTEPNIYEKRRDELTQRRKQLEKKLSTLDSKTADAKTLISEIAEIDNQVSGLENIIDNLASKARITPTNAENIINENKTLSDNINRDKEEREKLVQELSQNVNNDFLKRLGIIDKTSSEETQQLEAGKGYYENILAFHAEENNLDEEKIKNLQEILALNEKIENERQIAEKEGWAYQLNDSSFQNIPSNLGSAIKKDANNEFQYLADKKDKSDQRISKLMQDRNKAMESIIDAEEKSLIESLSTQKNNLAKYVELNKNDASKSDMVETAQKRIQQIDDFLNKDIKGYVSRKIQNQLNGLKDVIADANNSASYSDSTISSPELMEFAEKSAKYDDALSNYRNEQAKKLGISLDEWISFINTETAKAKKNKKKFSPEQYVKDHTSNVYNARLKVYEDKLAHGDDASKSTAKAWLSYLKEEVALRQKVREEAEKTAEVDQKTFEKNHSQRKTQNASALNETELDVAEQKKHISSSIASRKGKLTREIKSEDSNIQKLKETSEHLDNQLIEARKGFTYEYVALLEEEKDSIARISTIDSKISEKETFLSSLQDDKQWEQDKKHIRKKDNESDEEYLLRLEEIRKKKKQQYEEEISSLKKQRDDVFRIETEVQNGINNRKAEYISNYSSANPNNVTSDSSLMTSLEKQYIDIFNKYRILESQLGSYDQDVIKLKENVLETRDQYISATMGYIAGGGDYSKVSSLFEELSKKQESEANAALITQKLQTEEFLTQAQKRKELLETSKSELDIEKEKRIEFASQNKEAYDLFRNGMTSDQKLASFNVDQELIRIQELQEKLDRTPKNGDEFKEISKQINEAKSHLMLFREEAEATGLLLSEITGRMYLKGSDQEKSKIVGVSYTGLKRNASDTDLFDYDKSKREAKALATAQLKNYHHQSEYVEKKKEEVELNKKIQKMQQIAGMSDEQAEVTIRIKQAAAAVKDWAKITEEEKTKLHELYQQAEKLGLVLETNVKDANKKYVKSFVGYKDFVANPEQYATNKYLRHMLSSPDVMSYDLGYVENYRGATESTLQNIQNILKAGIKVKVVDKLDSHGKLNNNVNIDADKPGYIPYTKNADKTSGYGKNEKGNFNIKGYQEVAKELGLLQKSKDGNLFVSKKDRNKVYSEMDKRGIARYLEEDTNATKKNIEAKKKSKKVVDKDTDATKQNSQAKKSNAERERGKDFGDGAKYINSDISVARKQLARKNLGDDTRNKWQSIFNSATAEAERRGYKKNAQDFYLSEEKKQEKAKETTAIVEQEKKKQKQTEKKDAKVAHSESVEDKSQMLNQLIQAEQKNNELIAELTEAKGRLDALYEERLAVMKKYDLSGFDSKTVKEVKPQLSEIKKRFDEANAELTSRGMDGLSPEDIVGNRKTLLDAWNKLEVKIEEPIATTSSLDTVQDNLLEVRAEAEKTEMSIQDLRTQLLNLAKTKEGISSADISSILGLDKDFVNSQMTGLAFGGATDEQIIDHFLKLYQKNNATIKDVVSAQNILPTDTSNIDLQTASLKELYAEYERLGDVIAEAALAEDKFAEQRLNEAVGKHGQVVDQLSNRYGFNIGYGDTALAPGVSSIADTKAYVLSFKEESDKASKELGEDGKQAGKEFGKSLEEGANDALGINSPSTVFQEIAHWCGEGFKIGWDDKKNVIYGSISEWRDKLVAMMKSEKITMNDLISFVDSDPTLFDGRSSITKAVKDIINKELLLPPLEKAEKELRDYIASNKVAKIKENPEELIKRYDAYISAGGTDKDFEEIAKKKSSLPNFVKEYKEALNVDQGELKKQTDESNGKITKAAQQVLDIDVKKYIDTYNNAKTYEQRQNVVSQLEGRIRKGENSVLNSTSTANAWKQKLPELKAVYETIIGLQNESINKSKEYRDQFNSDTDFVIAKLKEYGIELGNYYDVKQSFVGDKPLDKYTFKGEYGTGSIELNKEGTWVINGWKEINKTRTEVVKLKKEISNLHGVNINLLDASDPAMFGTYADKVKEAKDALTALRAIEENGYSGEPIEDLVQKLELVKRVSSELKGSLQVGESEDIGKIDTSRLNQVRQQLEALAFSTSKGSVEIKKMSKNNTELTYTVRTADNMLQTYTITMNKYTGALTKTLVSEEKHLSGFQKALKGIGAKFQEIFRYTIASVSIYEVFNFIKQGVNVVKEMDAAMTELRKVSNDTEAALQSFRKEAFEIANTIGSTGKEIVNSAADWERLGYSIQEASELARNSALYANVGDMEIDVATEHMVSTLKAFNIEAKDSIRIVDKFNEIGNSYAITSSGIGEALERSASSLVAAGNDIDKSIALITAGNIVSQDPESVGNAIKVLSLRVRGSKTELEEMGEETDNLASSTSKLRSEILDLTGVDLMLDDNTYKDTYTILLEISKVWDQLSDVSQANVLEKLAGKTRASVVAGLLQQGETLEQVYKDSQNAAGSAEEENQKYMESIQGHLDVLTNKWQQMWDSGINADFINFFIDLGAGVLDVVNKIGLLKSSFLALGTVFTGKEIFKAFKGEGRVKMFTLRKYAFEEFNGDVCELRIA